MLNCVFFQKSGPASLFLLFCVALPLTADGRAALVIGNSAYASNALTNPVNDATDIAAALKGQGFEVQLRTDADYAGMDAALADFEKALKGKDTALFYYAGHGVQADGENYLIPVKEDISSLAKAKSRGVPLADVLARIKDSGVSTALIFLDACRDNPFPGSNRSGARGLAAIAAPRDVETLIAYATQPGDVAQDGSGRNGVFTAAVLKNLGTPGKTVGEVMTQVKADVKAATGGKQQPRVDDGLSRAVYLNDPSLASARAQLAAAKSQSELAAIDKQMSDLQTKLNAAKTNAEKQKLQVEQQRQQALQAAMKLEADNLAAEAARQALLVAQAQQAALQRQQAELEAQQQQDALGQLAASRRAELERLSQSAASEDPDILINTVERLEAALAEVDAQFASAKVTSLAASKAAYEKQEASLSAEKPSITESDAEFSQRMSRELQARQTAHERELADIVSRAELQRLLQTKSIRTQYEATKTTLYGRTWTITGQALEVVVGEFDRNSKTWPLTVLSREPSLPFLPRTYVKDLSRAPNPAGAILALDAAVKANALVAEADWGITAKSGTSYSAVLRQLRVRNLATGEVVVASDQTEPVFSFLPGERTQPTLGRLVVKSGSEALSAIGINGQWIQASNLDIELPPQNYQLDFKWPGDYATRQIVHITPGSSPVRASKPSQTLATQLNQLQLEREAAESSQASVNNLRGFWSWRDKPENILGVLVYGTLGYGVLWWPAVIPYGLALMSRMSSAPATLAEARATLATDKALFVGAQVTAAIIDALYVFALAGDLVLPSARSFSDRLSDLDTRIANLEALR